LDSKNSIINNIKKYIYNEMEYLDKVAYENTTPFIPPITTGKVVKVYDGDTFTLAAKLPNTSGPVYRFTVRLNGIDTPEIKGKTATEKELAKRARDALNAVIMNKIVVLKNVATEKYGRLLADVYVDETFCVNEYMITNKFAVKYDGGTKERPDDWN
jgi:endonuclease YncB( thermonuclease family)